MSTDAPKLSPVEGFKDESRYLRGTIPDELAQSTDHFGKADLQLLKFHGTYQQDDRDSRKAPGGKAYSFMIRTRIPSGILTSDQFVAHLDMCDQFGNSTMKLTTRQAIQLHGVPKTDLKATIAQINKVGLSTLAACGDVNRNVMCCPAKRTDGIQTEIQETAVALAMHFAPRTVSYQQCWLVDDETGEKQLLQDQQSPEDVEPIYGKTYLPRKFKIGIALPEDNCIDVYTQDLGMIAVIRDGKIIGYNFTVGGGMGTTPSAAKTFPALGKRMAFVKVADVLKVAEAVVIVQRDHGNRADRKIARLKYLIADWGVEKFRAAVEKQFGAALDDCTEDDIHGFDDHIGWQDQGDGKWSYGLNVENGRLSDGPERQWKACFREICGDLKPEIRLTSHQSAILCDIAPEDKPKLIEILKKHGIPVSEEVSTVRRWSMACVGLPTCGLSITESERALPGMIDELEAPLAKLGLDKDAFTIRMTGCPNGCARPYNSDIGLVGKAKGKYTVFVGGALLGHRLNFIFRDLVPTEEVPATLITIFTVYKQHRQDGETLGDFCARVGKEELEKLCTVAV